jgi:hypothetical protein
MCNSSSTTQTHLRMETFRDARALRLLPAGGIRSATRESLLGSFFSFPSTILVN